MAVGNGSTEKELRVMLVGDDEVGKTTIFNRFKTGQFVEHDSRIHISDCKKHISSEGREATIVLIDRGRRRSYYWLEDDYYELVHAYLFVYSITDSESMDSLCAWHDSLLMLAPLHGSPLCLLVGNKCDLEEDREISSDRARNMADNLEIESDNFFEISANTGKGFDEIFDFIVQKLGTNVEKGKSSSLRRSRFKIDDRVYVRDKHGVPHHGTVCWTGVKKRIGRKDGEMCIEIQVDISVSSSEIPGAKTGFTDLFKSKSNATIVVPESLVTRSNTRSPHTIISSSPKMAHSTAASHGFSSQTSLEDYQIIDRMSPLAEDVVTRQTVAGQSLGLDQTGDECHIYDQRDSQGEQDLKDTQSTLHANLASSSDLTIESRVQIPRNDPDNPLAFGVIRWIGNVKNRGLTAGVEMDKYSEGYSDGTMISTGQKFFSCSPGHGFYCPIAELQPDTGSREYYLKQLQQLEATLKELKTKYTSLPPHSSDLQMPLSEASTEKQLKEIKAENDSLHQQLHQEKLLSSDLQRQLSDTSVEKQHQQAKAEELKAENITFKQQLRQVRLQSTKLQKQFSEISKEKEHQQAKVEDLAAKNTVLQQQIQEEKLLSADLQKQLLETSTETLQQQLHDERLLSADLQKRLSELFVKNQSLLNAQQESVAFGIEPWKVSRTDIQLDRMIGGGGWGAVHKGKLQVAVKQFYPNILSERNLARLRREMRMLALVRHPNILQFIAAVFDESGNHKKNPPYIVTELLDTSLRALYEEGAISEKNQVSIYLDTAQALDYLHQRYEPIIHRDVSSANVLLKRNPNNTWLAKLSDLGSANLAQDAYTMNEGARVYCAPEAFTFDINAQSDVTLTPKVDVYSYGIMLCEVATSTFPEAKKVSSMLEQVSTNWSQLHQIIVPCIKDNPGDRPTMARIVAILREFH